MTGKTNQKKTDGEISIPEVNDTFPDDEAILEEMADELTEDLDADIEVGFTDDPDEDLPEEAADDDALLDDLSESRLKDAEFDERLAKLVKKGKNNKNVLDIQYIDDFFGDGELSSVQIDKLYSVLEENEIDVLEIDVDKEVDPDADGSDLDIPKDETEDMIKDDLTIPDTISTEDPVRLYLKEIGKVPLLTAE